MKVYIVTYRYMADKERGIWTSDRILPEGYTTLEAAQDFIKRAAGDPVKISNWYFQTENLEEYYIRKVTIKI